MTWAAERGFAELMQSYNPEWVHADAHEWRQRDILLLLKRFLAAQGINP